MSLITDAASALASVDPSITGKRRLILLGHPKCESGYGYYKPFNNTPDGSPSHNWGALYAKGDRGTFQTVDSSDEGVWYPQAAWNSSAIVGARQYIKLIRYSYPEAWAAAALGDAWKFAKALWRDGPGSSRPPYYGGFKPGSPNSIAPKGTIWKSPQDYYYRILAYARYVQGCANEVARALGEPQSIFLKPPPPPRGMKSGSKSSGGALGALLLVGGGGWLLTRSMGRS